MKKTLMILPLIALLGGALTSCGEEPGPVGPTLDESKLAPEDFLGHKRVTKLEENKEYYLAVCKYNEDEQMMFLNGEPHSDDNGVYPFYMSETRCDTEEEIQANAAKVSVEFVNDNDDYIIHISKPGATNDNKYIGIYKAESKFGNDVMSIHCADEAGEDYYDPDKKQTYTCDYLFTWLDKYEFDGVEYAIQTLAIMIQDERYEEAEAEAKFIGTGGTYISMDCANAEKAMAEDYNLAYFYEI